MKKSNLLILAASAILLTTGCKKEFLEKYPLDQLEDVSYWTSESNVRTFAWNFYARNFPGYASSFDLSWGGFFTGESLNDDVAASTRFTVATPATSTTWTNAFTWIRRANLMHDRVQSMTSLNTEAKNHWLGIARFFRALEHANGVNNFGDFPWYDKVMEPNDPDLYKDRDSRTYVMDKVLADFRFAAQNVKPSDGENVVVNKYSVLALMSRIFLFEGTWQKYHNNNTIKANEYLEAAKWAANEVMSANKYSLVANYRTNFNSESLGSNSEVILFRKYENGIIMHSLMSYHNNHEAQTGYSKSAIDSYLAIDGRPIGLAAAGTYDGIVKIGSARKAKAMIGRDPRINATFADSLRIVGNTNGNFLQSTSGYASIKFLDESKLNTPASLSSTNTSDAPEIRYAEVLLNYIEAVAELGTLTQTDLNKTVNLLRKRAGFGSAKLPDLEVVGGNPAVGGVVYDDPNRDQSVPSMIWEIRRERRVELLMEGFRNDDLRRWKKLEYTDQVTNINANRGAYIDRADYPGSTGLVIEGGSTIGYIKPVQDAAMFRRFDNPRVYLAPLGSNEIKLYKDNGATLTQNPGW